MPDAENHTYSPRRLDDWQTDPLTTADALDELGSRAQGGLVDLYDGTGGQTVNGSSSTLNIDTTRTNSDTAMFALSSDVLTVTQVNGGTIDLSYRTTIGNLGVEDFGYDIWLEQAPAATGTFAEVVGSRVRSGCGPSLAITNVSSNTTLDGGDSHVFVDASGGAITITLPAASAARQVYIKKTDSSANAVTIDGNGSETIDDSTTRVLSSQYDSVTLVSDASEWWVV